MRRKLSGMLALALGVGLAANGAAQEQTLRLSNDAVKDLRIRGRVQTQFGVVSVENDEGSDDYSTFEVRRARIGMRGTLFDNVRAQLEANLVPGSSLSMRSAFLQWRKHNPAYIKVGVDKPHSSIEENTSSASILTIERSLINGLVAAPGALNGLAIDGTSGRLVYGAGVYTDTANRNADNSEAKYLLNAMAAINLNDLVGEGNTLLVRANYLNSDDASGSFGSSYDDAMIFGTHLTAGNFDLRGEYFIGDNDGNKNRGFYITPSLHLTPAVQAVARFERAESDNARGIRAPGRYARRVESLAVREIPNGDEPDTFDPQRGDEYQALYLGVNYYMTGHAHKLMFGVESAELDNTDAGTLESLTASVAWRMLF